MTTESHEQPIKIPSIKEMICNRNAVKGIILPFFPPLLGSLFIESCVDT